MNGEGMEKERSSELQRALEKKRFVLSHETFAKERIHGMRKIFNELKTQHPELLSFHLYGSATKGNMDPESDIDTLIFLDGEKAVREEEAELVRCKEVETTFRTKLVDILDFDRDFAFSKNFTITVNIISKDRFDSDLKYAREEYEKLEQWKKENPDWKDIESHWAMWSRVSNLSGAAWRLLGLFMGVSIGRDIKKYRKYVLNKLKEMGPTGEQIWQEMIRIVRVHERADMKDSQPDESYKDSMQRWRSKYKELYPQTIDAAIKKYLGNRR